MKRTAILAVLFALVFDGAAFASSCMRVNESAIKFKRGSTCWEYSGKNNRFTGNFAQGQSITVSMFGLAEFATENGGTEKKWLPRDISISGPNKFFTTNEIDDNSGTLRFVTPITGRYVFDFYPCAMWGYYGEVRICAE